MTPPSQVDIDAAVTWLFDGEVGISSETLCRAFLGRSKGNYDNRPSDVDDFHRCRLFIECLSAAGRTSAFAAVCERYPDWIPLIREWDSLCALMDEEAPNWRYGTGYAPKTYSRMKILEVEGLRLRYPKADIQTFDDGSLSSMDTRERRKR